MNGRCSKYVIVFFCCFASQQDWSFFWVIEGIWHLHFLSWLKCFTNETASMYSGGSHEKGGSPECDTGRLNLWSFKLFTFLISFLLPHKSEQSKDCFTPLFQASGFHMTLGLLTRHGEDEEESGWEPFAKVWKEKRNTLTWKEGPTRSKACEYFFFSNKVSGLQTSSVYSGWTSIVKDNQSGCSLNCTQQNRGLELCRFAYWQKWTMLVERKIG